MQKKAPFLSVSIALFWLASSQWSTAQTPNHLEIETIDIGHARVLEIHPPKFYAYSDNSRCEALAGIEWITIPAVFEIITETVIVQHGYTDVEVSPPVYTIDGAIKTAAKANLIEIPAVTKEVSRRVVKTPARQVKRIVPALCTPQTRRRLVDPRTYKIKDKSGEILDQFETPEALADYLNSK